jgi:hypothetical protein
MTRNAETIEMIGRRHPEWREHQLRWRWLLDSLEGGDRYRNAVYGYDRRGLPVRNLVRHKREYPDPRDVGMPPSLDGLLITPPPGAAGSAADAMPTVTTDDDYELRRTRTPVPTFVAEAVTTHLARVYSREVTRSGSPKLTPWWGDVDGSGATIDHWMSETLAPLLLTLGQVDVLMDHPPAPEGEVIETLADVTRLGLDRCIASVILPEDMLWWKLDATGRRYEECLVRETQEDDHGVAIFYRHWTDSKSTLYDSEGDEVATTPHPFGEVPIIRVFDARKPRCRNIGQSRYEGIAERQREYYNRDSELILSDTTQAHPLLQGPEDFVQADGSIPIGPSWLLPKKKNASGNSTTYEGFSVVDFPKDGADSIRKNKADIRDDVDRDSALIRPAGRDGVPQSGLAKMFDHADGNNKLVKIAKVLERAEAAIASLASLVLSDGAEVAPSFVVVYPGNFDLFSAGDVAGSTAEFQSLVAMAGALPMTEALMLGRVLRLCLPGLSDGQYADSDAEIAAYLAEKSKGFRADPPKLTIQDQHKWGSPTG